MPDPTFTAPPVAPQPTDSKAVFNTRAFSFFGWFSTLTSELTAAVAWISGRSTTATDAAAAALASQVAADASQTSAATSALDAAASAGAAIWVSGTTYAIGAVRYSPVTQRIYRRLTAGAGTTDPSADGTNWALVDNSPLAVIVSGTTQTALANTHYVLTNVAATTVTLPASPAAGSTVTVTWVNNLATNVIARNAQTIMGLAENMTLDASQNSTVQLRFINSSWRLV